MSTKKRSMKLPFPFKSKDPSSVSSSSSWPWPLPTCGTPRTVSFRATNVENDIFKTMNSAYLDGGAVDLADAAPDSCCCISPCESQRFSSVPEVFAGEDDSVVETVIRGLRSERLFFEPGETSSILETAKLDDFQFKESVVMAVDSSDPFLDFRRSMEEMVEAHGLKDWECLQDLLSCYLRVNGKSNHGYIVGAFVDLLVHLANANTNDSPENSSSSSSNVEDRHQFPDCSTCSVTHSFTSPLSFCSATTSTTATATDSGSHSVSLVEVDDEMERSSCTTMDNASSSSSNNINV